MLGTLWDKIFLVFNHRPPGVWIKDPPQGVASLGEVRDDTQGCGQKSPWKWVLVCLGNEWLTP